MGRDVTIFIGLIAMLVVGVAWVATAIVRIAHAGPRRRS